MNHTGWVEAFIRLLPFKSRLSLRLRHHLEQCPKCLGQMADIREARTATIGKDELGKVEGFWPQFVLALEGPKPEKRIRAGLGWGWAVGTAGLLALAVIVAFFLVPSSPQGGLSSGVKLRINYVRMYEEPAQAFIFQTQDANSTFVWVEKQKSGEAL